jgi:signal transduction histidine kinase
MFEIAANQRGSDEQRVQLPGGSFNLDAVVGKGTRIRVSWPLDTHISVDSQIGISEEEVPDSLKTPIFRICQEAMNNIAKYSKASLVNLSLKKRDAQIGLTIQDNGQGFDLETVKKGMGLSTMKERAQLSGGSFSLETAKGKGTIVLVSWAV